MITQYVHNGEVIATRYQLFDLPHDLKVPTRQTIPYTRISGNIRQIEDLAPTRRPIKCVVDSYEPIEFDLDKMMKTAFIKYQEKLPRSTPKFISWSDNIRWKVRKTLLRWKVIV